MEYTNAGKSNVKKGKPTGLTNGTENGNAEAHPKETWEEGMSNYPEGEVKMEPGELVNVSRNMKQILLEERLVPMSAGKKRRNMEEDELFHMF